MKQLFLILSLVAVTAIGTASMNAPQNVTYEIQIKDANGFVGDAVVYINSILQTNHNGRVLITIEEGANVNVRILKEGYDTVEASFTAVRQEDMRKIYYLNPAG